MNCQGIRQNTINISERGERAIKKNPPLTQHLSSQGMTLTLPNTSLSLLVFPITLQVGHALTIEPEIFHNCSLPQVDLIYFILFFFNFGEERRGKIYAHKPNQTKKKRKTTLPERRGYFSLGLKAKAAVLWMFKLSASLFWRALLRRRRLEQKGDAWHRSRAGDQSLSPSPWKCIWTRPNPKPQTKLYLHLSEALPTPILFYFFFLPACCSARSPPTAAPREQNIWAGASFSSFTISPGVTWRRGWELGGLWHCEGGQGTRWKPTR